MGSSKCNLVNIGFNKNMYVLYDIQPRVTGKEIQNTRCVVYQRI